MKSLRVEEGVCALNAQQWLDTPPFTPKTNWLTKNASRSGPALQMHNLKHGKWFARRGRWGWGGVRGRIVCARGRGCWVGGGEEWSTSASSRRSPVITTRSGSFGWIYRPSHLTPQNSIHRTGDCDDGGRRRKETREHPPPLLILLLLFSDASHMRGGEGSRKYLDFCPAIFARGLRSCLAGSKSLRAEAEGWGWTDRAEDQQECLCVWDWNWIHLILWHSKSARPFIKVRQTQTPAPVSDSSSPFLVFSASSQTHICIPHSSAPFMSIFFPPHAGRFFFRGQDSVLGALCSALHAHRAGVGTWNNRDRGGGNLLNGPQTSGAARDGVQHVLLPGYQLHSPEQWTHSARQGGLQRTAVRQQRLTGKDMWRGSFPKVWRIHTRTNF